MQEAVKFTFTSEDKERSIIWKQFDGNFIMIGEAVHWPSNHPLLMDVSNPLLGDATVEDPIWPECHAVGDHRPKHEIWFDAERKSGDHILQFDLIPMNRLTKVTLQSVKLSGIEYTPEELKFNNVLTTYQLVWAENFTYRHNTHSKGELVTADLNRDNQRQSNKYYKFNWTEEQSIHGRGSWQFKFSNPFVPWYEEKVCK